MTQELENALKDLIASVNCMATTELMREYGIFGYKDFVTEYSHEKLSKIIAKQNGNSVHIDLHLYPLHDYYLYATFTGKFPNEYVRIQGLGDDFDEFDEAIYSDFVAHFENATKEQLIKVANRIAELGINHEITGDEQKKKIVRLKEKFLDMLKPQKEEEKTDGEKIVGVGILIIGF